jgi:hypothetical protein
MENHSSWHAVRVYRSECQRRAARGNGRLVRSLYAAPRLYISQTRRSIRGDIFDRLSPVPPTTNGEDEGLLILPKKLGWPHATKVSLALA